MSKKTATLSLFFVLTVHIIYGANIKVNITGIKKPEGEMMIYLYSGEETYMKPDKALKIVKVDVTGNQLSYTFDNLDNGEYAVALHHDADKDGKMKTFLHIPREGFGFSRNYRPKTRAPKYDEVKFNVEGDTTIEIRMIYF